MEDKVRNLITHGYSTHKFITELTKFNAEDPRFSSYFLSYLTEKYPRSFRSFYHGICCYRPDIINDKFVLDFIKSFENSKKLSDLSYVSQILHLILKRVRADQLEESTIKIVIERINSVDLFIELKKL